MKKDLTHALAVSWTSKLNRCSHKEGIDLQKMILGMEIILHNIPKLVLMVIIASLLGTLYYTLATWLSFVLIRRYACGLHAGSGINCTIMTLLMFVAAPYVMQGVYINEITLILAFVLIGFGLYRYAPADTEARPIIGKNKRARLKKSAILTSLLVLALTLILRQEALYVLVTVGALYALIVVLPPTYTVLGRSMKNYERYE